ncbi:MAG: Formyl transferase, C-terminal domain, partial [Bacteroidota bacterium]|nr:Formyl transferase, C-terminal domain [Bacteroidota bacterium]
IEKSNLSSGQFDISGDNFTVGCGSGSLSLLEIQPQNKKPLKVSDFLRGYRGDKNSFFV